MGTTNTNTVGKSVILIGMGGHSKVIADIARRSGWEILGHLDDRVPAEHNPLWLGPIDSLAEWKDHEGVYVVVAIGDNVIREKIVQRLAVHGVRYATLVDPSAILGTGVTLAEGTVVMPGVIVNADARIGAHVILNTAATVDHDGVIADYAHLSPGCHLAGAVTIERAVHMGTGALAIPGVTVGAYTKVGAGATVIADLPEHVVAVGVPARIIKTLETVRVV